MTRQDFEFIAEILSMFDESDTIEEVRAGFENALALTNPRFDRDRFAKAAKGDK